MRVAIIGAGAMGSLYGGYLSKAAKEVYLIDVWQQHIDSINSSGLSIDEKNGEVVVFPKAESNPEAVGHVDLAIIFVKSIMTESALKKNISLIGPDTIVLSLQNGYGNVDQISKFVKMENIIAGTTAHGATMVSPAHIKHAGSGETHIGWVRNAETEKIGCIADMLRRSGFETTVSENVMELIWSKLIVNVGINALTALLKLKNGEILLIDESKELLNMAVMEAVEVAGASGIEFDGDFMAKKVMDVAFSTGENKSSMLQDILNKRKTEVDMINGAVVREGQKYGIETPVNGVLTKLVKALEKCD
jgi:2-dehydropantoate 2-reductase